MTTIFEFERDFAGSLRCIPMVVRQKLDLVGIKLTLRQWSRMPREVRATLSERPCDDAPARTAYAALVLAMIAAHTDEAPRHLAEPGLQDWQSGDHMPDAVREQAAADGVPPPSPRQWAALDPLRRFALVKLARASHENLNFVPALREFGLLDGVRPEQAAPGPLEGTR